MELQTLLQRLYYAGFVVVVAVVVETSLWYYCSLLFSFRQTMKLL